MLVFAVKMLVGDRPKFLGVVMGVLFTTFLMAHMLSMFASMIGRTFATIADISEADVWVMDPAVEYVEEIAGLPATSVDRVRSVEGVEWAVPLYAGTLRARLAGGQFRAVQVIGVDDATLIGAPRDLISGTVQDLRRADSVLVDRAAADELLRVPVRPPALGGPDPTAPTRPLRVGDELMINDHRVVVAGFARVSARFMLRPTLYMTYSHALAIAPRERSLLSFVLAKARPGMEPEAVARRIAGATGLRARTAAQFKADTAWYVSLKGGVIVRLGIMVGISVAIGSIVTGLLMHMFTVDNLRYYGTLKALGAVNAVVVRMVAAQALVCGAVGFGLGIGASALVGLWMAGIGQPYLLIWPTVASTGVVVVAVCMLGGAISAWKVMRVEPAVVFKA